MSLSNFVVSSLTGLIKIIGIVNLGERLQNLGGTMRQFEGDYEISWRFYIKLLLDLCL